MHSFLCKRAFNSKHRKIRSFPKIPSLVGSVAVSKVIVTNYVIGGLIWVHLIKLADVTVRFQESDNSQPYTISIEK